MEFFASFLTSLNLAGLVLAVFFIMLLLSKRDKKLHHYLLSFFILLLGTYLMIKYVAQFELFQTYPIFIYLDIYYWVLLGPTLYLYTLTATRNLNSFKLHHLFTLIPAILVTFCFSEYILGNIREFFSEKKNPSIYVFIGYLVWLYNSLVFYVLVIVILKKHKRRIRNNYSFTEQIDLKWMNYLSHGFLVFLLFILSKGLLLSLFDWEFPIENYSISLFVVFLYIFGIGYYGYKQRIIVQDVKNDFIEVQENKTTIIAEKRNDSYKKSGLNREEAIEIAERLTSVMQKEELFLEPELQLTSLAQKIEVSNHKLSQVINEYLEKNFFDFINEYRIQKAKELLADPENNHFKITSIAYDSGFNSKSTFYNLFRRTEGITPTEFRKKNQPVKI